MQHSVTLYPLDGSPAVDLSCLADAVDLTGGRDDSGSQPDAAAATIAVSVGPDDDPLPTTVEIGARIVVTTTTLTGHVRFTGWITDVALGWDEAGPDTPNTWTGQIIATGPLAAAGRRLAGVDPFPQELDGARVSRIMAEAGITLNPATSDPGTVQILARDAGPQSATELARAVAQSATGVLWETRAGVINYADAVHRRGVVAALTLDACDILVTPTWRRTTEGLINEVSIGYGVPAEGGEAPRYVADNASSVTRYGRYNYDLGTELAAEADAAALGQLLLVRNSSPVWVMGELPIDVAGLDAAAYEALLDLELHDLIILTGLPAVGGAPTSASLWVEGWKEHLEAGTHEMSLVVSGYCRSAPPPRWDDLDPAWTWDTMPASLTWDDATCLGPADNFGRWDDVPASLRWDGVDPATTWDTWT